MRPRRLYSTNKSGTPGVTWSAAHKRWVAYICFGGKMKWLGTYDNIEDATAARKQGELVYWSEKVPGVIWHEDIGKWIATISEGDVVHFIGFYDTREEAIEARRQKS